MHASLVPLTATGIDPEVLEGDAAFWTEHRIQAYAWLDDARASLAELYHGALRMLYADETPGRSRLISHCVREIGNRLPDALVGPKGEKFEWINRLDTLVREWSTHGLPLDGNRPAMTGDEAGPPQPDEVTLPSGLYLEVATLLVDFQASRENPREKALRLFQELGDEEFSESLYPVVNQWVQTIRWFVERVHDNEQVDADCDWSEFTGRFQLFEFQLLTLARRFTENMEDLDDILERANTG